MQHLYWLLKLNDIRDLFGALSLYCFIFAGIWLVAYFLFKLVTYFLFKTFNKKANFGLKIIFFLSLIFGLSFLTASKLLPTTQNVLIMKQMDNAGFGMIDTSVSSKEMKYHL
jgi:hypothetical protein